MLYLTPLFLSNFCTSATSLDTEAVGVPMGMRQKSFTYYCINMYNFLYMFESQVLAGVSYLQYMTPVLAVLWDLRWPYLGKFAGVEVKCPCTVALGLLAEAPLAIGIGDGGAWWGICATMKLRRSCHNTPSYSLGKRRVSFSSSSSRLVPATTLAMMSIV